MKASLLRQGFASITLVLIAAGQASAGPLVSGSVRMATGEKPEATLVELFPILPDFELGKGRFLGVERFEPAAAGRPTTEGRFQLEAPESGLYRLVVRTPGDMPVQIGPIALVGDLEVAPVTPPRDVGASFEVIDAEGLPVAGAWAFAYGDENVENGWRLDLRLGKTDADGRLTLPRRPGERLGLSIFSPSRGEVRLDGFEGGRVRMPPADASPRLLRVVSEDGAPLPGVLLRYSARAWPVGLSDANGTLRLPPSTGQPEELRLVTPAGFQHSLPAPASALKAEDLTVRLPAAGTMLGRIVDARTGRPVAGALVWSDQDHGAFAVTDANGRYSLAALAGEGATIEAAGAGYLKARGEVTPAQMRSGRAPTLGLERAASLAGSVVESDRPIAGAIVEAVYYAARGERELDPGARVADRASTNAQGRFRLRRLALGQRYELRARREGYFPTAIESTVLDLPAPGGPVRLELAPIRALAGQVTDSKGRALGDVGIEVQPAMRAGRTPPTLKPVNRKETFAPPQTDTQGRFLLTAPPAATVDVVFRKSGYAPFSMRRVRIPRGDGPFNLGQIVLRPGVALRGRVMDTAGRPVVGAQVFLLEEEQHPFQTTSLENRPMSATSQDGAFAFHDLSAAVPLHLFVRARGYQTALLRDVRPPKEQPLVVTLQPGLSLRGRVVDEAGKPIPRAVVEASWHSTLPDDPQRRPRGTPISFRATTVRSGRFEIEGVPRGLVTLSAEARGFIGEKTRALEAPLPEGSPEIKIVLKTGALLTGRVTTTEGEPVSRARVRVGDAGGVSDEEGQYLVEGAPPGPQRVSVVHPEYPRLETTHRLGPELNTLDLQLEAGVEVSGRVMDEQGRPVLGARVALRSADRLEHTAVSAPDGGFAFRMVAPARYRLGAEREGYAASVAPGVITVDREPVRGLEVTLRQGATLTGLILGLQAEELPRVGVEATLDGGKTHRAEVEADGHYRLASLEPGDWTIRASLWSGERQVTVRLTIRPEDRMVERDLEFRRQLRLTGHVLVGDEPLSNATISLRGRRFSSVRNSLSGFDGGFLLDDLEPDTYELGVSHPEQIIVHNQILEITEDREIEIRLLPTTVRGRVFAASSGAPLPGALVSLRHQPTPETPEFLVAGFTGLDGHFTLLQVLPGTYRLEVTADGYARLEQPMVIAAGAEPPEIDLGLESVPGLKLDVRLADGSAPLFVHLLARDAAGRIGAAATLAVDQTGRADLSTLAEGRWTLLVSAENAAAMAIEAQIPGPPVALTLPPTGRLHVRVPFLITSGRSAKLRFFSPAGHPLWTLEPGGSLRSEWVLFAGQATIAGLPEGAYTLDVEASDGRRWSGSGAIVASQETVVILE